MRIGYARVSTKDQHPEAQAARLHDEGRIDKLYTDKGASGKDASRPQWDECLRQLRRGDVLVIVKLDRIGRSLQNLVTVVNMLGERGVDIVALDQQIDTTTANGRLLFQILAAIAEWEGSIIRERTLDGLAAARVRHGGRLPGRKPSLSAEKIATARELFGSGRYSSRQVAEIVGTSRSTLYRHLKDGKEQT